MINFYRFITILVSIVSLIFILIYDKTNFSTNNLVLLPLCYLILFVLVPSFSKYIYKSIGITIINITMLIRYSIVPFLISIYGVNLNTGIYLSEKLQFKAINLMLYEMILIFIVFIIFQKKFYGNSTNKMTKIKPSNNLFGWLFIIICVFVIILYPSILNRYSFVWTATLLKSKEVEGVSYSFLLLLVQLGHLVLTISIINTLYKFYLKKKSLIFVILSLVTIVISSSFMIGTSRFSIILPLISGLFTMFILYKAYKKVIGFISVVVSFLLIGITTVLKNRTISGESVSNSINDNLSDLTVSLQLYFSGVSNVAHSINTRLIYEPYQMENIITDLLRTVVLINNFFINQSSALLNYNLSFYGKGNINDQILPMIGQGYLYFGYILAPIFTVITIIFVMYLDKKISENNSLFNIYILVYLCLKFALFNMANMTILISYLTNFYILLMIISILNKRIKIRRLK